MLITEGQQGASLIRSSGHFCFCATTDKLHDTLSYPTYKMRTVTFTLLGI